MASKLQAPRDKNAKTVIIGVSSIDKKTPVPIAVNKVTNAVIVKVG